MAHKLSEGGREPNGRVERESGTSMQQSSSAPVQNTQLEALERCSCARRFRRLASRLFDFVAAAPRLVAAPLAGQGAKTFSCAALTTSSQDQ